MKKLLLFAAGVVMGLSASAQWAVVGSYTDPAWDFDESIKFEGEGDNLSCTIDHLTSGFKIVDITNNSWDTQYGTSQKVQINTPVVLDGKNGGPDPANIEFPFEVLAINNVTVKWNPSTFTLELVASDADLETGYPTLYVTGSFSGWKTPGDEGTVEMSQEDGIYTATINLGEVENGEFKLAGSGWSNEIASGTADQTLNVGTEAVTVGEGGGNLTTALTGEQTLTFNYNTMLMTFGDPSLTDVEPEPKWGVVGTYTTNAWWFSEASVFEAGEDGNYTVTIDKLTPDFKIADLNYEDWSVTYSTATPIEIGKEYTLTFNEGANMTFEGKILYVNNATLVWNPDTKALTVNAADEDIIYGYPTLYVTGSFAGDNWPAPGEEGTVEMTQEDGIYTATINLGEAENVEFKVAGSGWSNEIGSGTAGQTLNVGTQVVTVGKGGGNLTTTLTGEQTLMFNYDEMTMWFVDNSQEGGEEGDGGEEGEARIWAVVGSYTDPAWDFDASTRLVSSDDSDVLSCQIANLTPGFKIVDITDNNWENSYGYYEPITIDTEYPLEHIETDGGNIMFNADVLSIANVTVQWNPETKVLKLVANQEDVITGLPTLYLTGTFNDWATPEEGVLGSEEDGIYTFFVDFGEVEEDEVVSFKIASAGWAIQFGGAQDGVEVGYEAVKVVNQNTKDLTTTLTGQQTLMFDYDMLEMWFVEDKTDGINGIDSSLEAPVYYNLQGVRVANPTNGIYVVKKGDKTYKAVIR